jgi:hypothetical protein
MDRIFSRLVVYLAIGLAVAYVWIHFNWIRAETNSMVSNWWH